MDKFDFKTPKTAQSKRLISWTGQTLSILKKCLIRQREENLALMKINVCNRLVFTREYAPLSDLHTQMIFLIQ